MSHYTVGKITHACTKNLKKVFHYTVLIGTHACANNPKNVFHCTVRISTHGKHTQSFLDRFQPRNTGAKHAILAPHFAIFRHTYRLQRKYWSKPKNVFRLDKFWPLQINLRNILVSLRIITSHSKKGSDFVFNNSILKALRQW